MYGVLPYPHMLGWGPLSVEDAIAAVQKENWHGALDPIEGIIYRVERRFSGNYKVDFLAKYVRPDKVDGSYLPEMSGGEPVWNWRPNHKAAE